MDFSNAKILGWVISMPAPAASPRSVRGNWVSDVDFLGSEFRLFSGWEAMTHAKQGIELFNATKDTKIFRSEGRWILLQVAKMGSCKQQF